MHREMSFMADAARVWYSDFVETPDVAISSGREKFSYKCLAQLGLDPKQYSRRFPTAALLAAFETQRSRDVQIEWCLIDLLSLFGSTHEALGALLSNDALRSDGLLCLPYDVSRPSTHRQYPQLALFSSLQTFLDGD
eukprot:Skav207254  [mRNA]  locus=scaffold2560:71341:71751:+ [translate_table: standard]